MFIAAAVALLVVVVALGERTRWGTDVIVGALAAFFLALALTARRDRSSIILLVAVALYAAYFLAASFWGVPRWMNLTVGIAIGGGYLLSWLVIPFVRALGAGFRRDQPR